MLNSQEVFLAVQIGVVAYVISVILTRQGMLLDKYLDFLFWVDNKAGSWLSKPLGLCEKCLSGQIAMWVWIINNNEVVGIDIIWSLFKMIIFISFSILSVTLFNLIKLK